MRNTIPDAAPPGDALQGILVRIASGVQQDIDALPDRADDRIHDIRVGMKNFRAVMRLAAAVLPERSLLRADKLARQLKEHFASTRDTEVLRALLRDLLGGQEASEAAEALGLPAAALGSEAAEDPAAGEICRKLNRFAEGLKLGDLRRKDLIEAWLCTYRNARRTMKSCSTKQEDDVLFHSWRKRVKVLLYQSAVLDFLPSANGIASGAQELSSALGAHHDLAMLCARLAQSLPGSHAEKSARSRKEALVSRALAIGTELFAKKPSRLQIDR